ncbi:MAG: hypothetical protein V3T86_10885 [Planctomycetota bacterium]
MRRSLLAAILLLLSSIASAGGGPETTLLVVNKASPSSKRIANEYARLRVIPPSQILYLDHIPHLRVLTLEEYRRLIRDPIRAHLLKTGLTDRIDLVAFSADFPYGVNFASLVGDSKDPQMKHKVGSLTGMLYLDRVVEAGGLDFMNLQGRANKYFRREESAKKATPRNANGDERISFNNGQKALMNGDYRNAVVHLAKCLETYSHPSVFFQYACALGGLKQKDAALDALEKAIALGWNQVDATRGRTEFARYAKSKRFKALLESMASSGTKMQPAQGFASAYHWTGDVEPERDVAADAVHRYRLAVMLAYTGEWGNSVPEVLAYLNSAAASDGTRPDGVFYFLANKDIRAKSRAPFFGATKAALEKRGHKAEILNAGAGGQTGVLPIGKSDVLGAVVGKASYRWSKSKSTIVPGAICENLTSFGAVFNHGGQTKLTELLRAGAAGSSGTVIEPFAIWQKFPHPFLHVHYVDGCSLAEAFYQSVASPFQLLVVGEPLARPFAKFMTVTPILDPSPLTGTVRVDARLGGETKAARWELWVDGRFNARAKPGAPIHLDTTQLDDGIHGLRLVAVEAGPIETRSSAIAVVTTKNHGRVLDITAQTPASPLHKPRKILGRAPGALRVEAWLGSWKVAEVAPKNGHFELRINNRDLGIGKGLLIVRAVHAPGPGAVEAVEFEVTAPKLGTPPNRVGPTLPGLFGEAELQDGTKLTVAATSFGQAYQRNFARTLRKQKIARLQLAGELEIPTDGSHQLLLETKGTLSVTLAGKSLLRDHAVDGQIFVPLHLKAGWYPIRIDLRPEGPANLVALLGGERVTAPLRTQHAAGKPLKIKPSAGSGQEALVDGKQGGAGVAVAAKGVTLSWKRAQKGIGTVALFPTHAKAGNAAFPKRFQVEWNKGGKWVPVKGLQIAVARGPNRPPKSKDKKVKVHEAPQLVKLTFEPVRTTKLRVRPEGGTAPLQEIEVYQAVKRRR